MGRFRRIRQSTSIAYGACTFVHRRVDLSSLVTVIALRFIWQRLLIYSIEHRLIGCLDGRASSATRVFLPAVGGAPESKIVTDFRLLISD